MQKSLLKLFGYLPFGSVDYSCCIAGLGQQKSGRLRHKAVITVVLSGGGKCPQPLLLGKPHDHTRCLHSSAPFFFQILWLLLPH